MKLSRRLAALAVAVAVLAPTAALAARNPRTTSSNAAARFLRSQQQRNGTWPGFGPGTQVDATGAAEFLTAMEASQNTRVSRNRTLNFIRANGPTDATTPGRSAKIVQALVALKLNPRAFNGVDYVARVDAGYDAVNGDWNEGDYGLYANGIAALGKLAADGALTTQSIDYFRSQQCGNGGWGFAESCAFGADSNSTAIILQVLRAAGVPTTDPDIAEARAYLLSLQNADGGFPSCPGCYPGGEITDSNSTGLVLSAIAALGENALAAPWLQADGDGPVKALKALQLRNGGYRFQAGYAAADHYSTVQGVVGMNNRSYPVR